MATVVKLFVNWLEFYIVGKARYKWTGSQENKRSE